MVIIVISNTIGTIKTINDKSKSILTPSEVTTSVTTSVYYAH